MNRIGASGGASSGGGNAEVLSEMANAEVRRQLEERVRVRCRSLGSLCGLDCQVCTRYLTVSAAALQ